MNIKLITSYNGINNELIQPLLKRLIEYCTKNKYDFEFSVEEFDNSLHKPKFIYKKLKEFSGDYLVWIDLDIYILDLNYRIENIIPDISKSIAISKEDNGMCAGFMIIKNNEFSLKLFDIINFLGVLTTESKIEDKTPFGGFLPKYKPSDQNIMKVLLHYFVKPQNELCFINEDIIQNPKSVFCNTAFAFHLWGIWSEQVAVRNILRKLEEDGYYNLYGWGYDSRGY